MDADECASAEAAMRRADGEAGRMTGWMRRGLLYGKFKYQIES